MSEPVPCSAGMNSLPIAPLPNDERPIYVYIEKDTEVPPPAFAALEMSIAYMQEVGAQALASAHEAYERSSDEVRQEIDKIVALVREQPSTNENQTAQWSYAALLAGRDNIPLGIKTSMLALEEIQDEIEAAQQELEQYTPDKTASVWEKVLQIESQLDYDKVVDTILANNNEVVPEVRRQLSMDLLFNVGSFIRARRQLEEGLPFTYQQLQSLERTVLIYEEEWGARGLLEGKREQANDPDVSFTIEDIVGIDTRIRDTYDLYRKYKGTNDTIEAQVQTVLNLTRYAEVLYDDLGCSPEGRYPNGDDGLGAAIIRRLVQTLGELPANDFELDLNSETYKRMVEQIRSVDLARAVNNLIIKGNLDALPFEFSEEDLRVFLYTSVPAAAIASVKKLEFRPLTATENKEGKTLGFNRWSEELGGPEIVISDVQIREHYQAALECLGSIEEAKEQAYISMLETIVHEFGHELLKLLPLGALKYWDEQCSKDPTRVTAYVKKQFDRVHPHRFMDDFTETNALFITQPETLSIISLPRFRAMERILDEFMPFYSQEIKPILPGHLAARRAERLESGISDEDLRSTYLNYESSSPS
jgi:hypothetical protein